MDNSRLVYSTDGSSSRDLRKPSAGRRKSAPTRRRPVPDDGVVRVSREKAGRRGKEVTVIRGLRGSQTDLRGIASELKRACGSGGSVKDGAVEIQGDHRESVVALLERKGLVVKLAGG
ncbi:MAG: translation initiation factor [Dehalococcoidia bacterium]